MAHAVRVAVFHAVHQLPEVLARLRLFQAPGRDDLVEQLPARDLDCYQREKERERCSKRMHSKMVHTYICMHDYEEGYETRRVKMGRAHRSQTQPK